MKQKSKKAFVLSRRNTNRFFRAFSPLLSKDEGEPRTREFFSFFPFFKRTFASLYPHRLHLHSHTLTRNNVFFTNHQHLPKSGLVQARLHVEAICFFFFESSRRAERKRVHGRNRRRRRPIRGEGVRNGGRDTGG